MFSKTEQFIAYIVFKRPRASITSIMKLSYLIDLVSFKNRGVVVSDFEYRRYTFGPFDKTIYETIERLVLNHILVQSTEYAPMGEEFTVFSFSPEKEDSFVFGELSSEEIELIDRVISELSGYGAKSLTELAYQTAPMQEKGATLGGNEHFNEVLNLGA